MSDTDDELAAEATADKEFFADPATVAMALSKLGTLKSEAQFAQWSADYDRLCLAVKVIEALRDKVAVLEQGRKGLDPDFSGLKQELNQARETITQLQSAGERAENLRLKLKETDELLFQSRRRSCAESRMVARLLHIIENLSATLGRFKPE